MKLLLKRLFITGVVTLSLSSCSRKNDSFLSRNFHAVTTEFNTLYNGNVALEEGKSSLVQTFNDNYWDILPIERIVFEENTALGEENRDPNFLRAEEKAIKAIQNHAMKIDGEERNPQMDEAFLLLGKARYYDQQFVPALEAFNYVLAYYPKSNNIAQAKVWKEKTNIRLENNEVAIANLEKIFKVENKLKDQDIADAKAMLAQAYLNLNKLDSALIYIKDASKLTRKSEERGRYNYIKGQLYNRLEEKDSANLAFQEVIDLNRKIPRKYHINAHIEQIRNYDYQEADTLLLRERLDKMVRNRENRPFLDKIYYAKADFFMKTAREDSAIVNYNKSLRQSSTDDYLLSRDYLALADYSFEQASYKIAGAYYDSVIGKISDRSREYRTIKKKRENLTDVIDYENLTQRNDSIIALVTLSEDSLTAYFDNYIAQIKAKKAADSIARIDNIRNNEFFNASSSGGRAIGGEPGEFYFYNDVAVSYGKQSFEKRWGKRRLVDGWRLSSTQSVPLNSGTLPVALDNPELDGEKAMTAADYIATLPREKTQVDSLLKERDFAYFQLGLIYKEKFKEYPLAAQRLEKLLAFNPDEKLVLPALYNLYQVYGAMNASAKANTYKNKITTEYPDSRYATRINNPDKALEADAESPEEVYKGLYKRFQNQNFANLESDLNKRIDQFYGDPYLPKFELLKATVAGRYEGYDAYKKGLSYVALTYPRTEEGKKAQSLLQNALPTMKFDQFDDEAIAINYKIVYPFNNSNIQGAKDLQKKLLESFDEVGYTEFSTSIDVYDAQQSFVVVHFLSSRRQAEGLVELLSTNKDILITLPSMVIASENYKIIQMHKNLDAYKAQDSN
ncbi:hypothetical protein [uncultured Dokdonia sp.]|uniref:type IX secretion system periplasmic lipoprotein PorW/SprE n=1 Tax=Dokdonia sp. R78006 TaxID=3093866 RepID=UPI00262AC2BC|nr:hypothetical protein [uncultured Dokdonia sp.]